MSMLAVFSNVFEEEEPGLDDLLENNAPMDYLKFFERPDAEPKVGLTGECSPSSSSSSPALTQQFDMGAFFDTSLKPKQLFEVAMPVDELHMFLSPVASWKKKEACLDGILRASLIREGHGHLLGPTFLRRRVKGKSSRPELCMHRLLHQKCEHERAPTGKDRKIGMEEAMRCVALLLTVPFKIARRQVRVVWNALPKVHRNLWTVKKGLTLKSMEYVRGIGWTPKDADGEACIDVALDRRGMDAVAVTSKGFIATWFTKLGSDHPAVIRWVQEGLRGDVLKEKLLTLTHFKTHFDAFSGWIEKLGQTFQSCQPACSMEMCYNSNHACQIHLHAFFGPEVSFRSIGRKPVEMCPTWKQLQWNGVNPHLEPMRCSGITGMEKAARRALYYITMDKVGMLFRASKIWPHED
jgi:hypothetical protein